MKKILCKYCHVGYSPKKIDSHHKKCSKRQKTYENQKHRKKIVSNPELSLNQSNPVFFKETKTREELFREENGVIYEKFLEILTEYDRQAYFENYSNFDDEKYQDYRLERINYEEDHINMLFEPETKFYFLKNDAYLGEEHLVIKFNNEKTIFRFLATEFPQFIYDYKKSNIFTEESEKRLKYILNELPYYEASSGERIIEDDSIFLKEEEEDFFDDEFESIDIDKYLLDEDTYEYVPDHGKYQIKLIGIKDDYYFYFMNIRDKLLAINYYIIFKIKKNLEDSNKSVEFKFKKESFTLRSK